MRAFLLVIDGFGIGAMPDAKVYNDYEANSLLNTMGSFDMVLPTLTNLGLFSIDGVMSETQTAKGAYGRLSELSKAKDTTVGHWEIAGIVTQSAPLTFPNGFPDKLISKITEIFKCDKVLLNKPYSGTDAIRDFGVEHLKTGFPIIYTSSDSVLQIACHTDLVPLQTLYENCERVRAVCTGPFNVSRIIARPFAGSHPFYRTPDRRDFSIIPPTPTLLDDVKAAGLKSIGVGKIDDIFCGKGLTDSYHTLSNSETMNKIIELAKSKFNGLVFANLIDTDMKYGHRRDVFGYAQELEELDRRFGQLLPLLKKNDVLYITSDHGNDPTHKYHTDHTREYVPLLIYGTEIVPTNLGTAAGFNTVAATIKQQFGLETSEKSLWSKITV